MNIIEDRSMTNVCFIKRVFCTLSIINLIFEMFQFTSHLQHYTYYHNKFIIQQNFKNKNMTLNFDLKLKHEFQLMISNLRNAPK